MKQFGGKRRESAGERTQGENLDSIGRAKQLGGWGAALGGKVPAKDEW